MNSGLGLLHDLHLVVLLTVSLASKLNLWKTQEARRHWIGVYLSSVKRQWLALLMLSVSTLIMTMTAYKYWYESIRLQKA
ncbi:hypothetical protein BJ878DRAFT_505978 [Calycina marina]|uniref:Uncharacterized protein n=1 Tax=Calycina marina TaxID=1763456 RepID=A0A9P7Z3J3_9HELO|nr:hypothetical protein BJ878DRAFT_505978 [Calycina marina]